MRGTEDANEHRRIAIENVRTPHKRIDNADPQLIFWRFEIAL